MNDEDQIMNDERLASAPSRRVFLKATSALSVLATSGVAAGLTACTRAEAPGPADTGTATAAQPFELEEWSVAQLGDAMRQGQLTSRAVTERYLARIAAVDQQGPMLRSVIETNPDALTIAEGLDDERRSGRVRGPLHGVPVLIKDNIDTADRMSTTAGSLALEGSIAPRDSSVAERLRTAGAVILGKTNLSEWANFRSTRSSSGWSGRGGQCRNPYALDRNPCGSSSGSGAATSASLCAIAIGTETDGSIVCPSSANGLVGIKPTVGLVSRAGIIPISHSQDTAGPMARTVADAAVLLSAIAGADPRDAATAASRGHLEADYTKFLDPDGLKGARIGIARKYFGFHDRVDALMAAAIDDIKRLGAETIDPIELSEGHEIGDAEMEVLLYEFKADLNAYLAGLAPGVTSRSLADLIAFNEQNHDREMPYFGQELFVRAEAKGPLTTKEYVDALAKSRRLARAEGIDLVMAKHRLDAILAPTGGPAWVTDLVDGDHFGGGASTLPAVAGYPHVTVPCGAVFGLPVGLSFFGRAWSEPTLIRIAFAYEQATKHRRVPGLLPTAEL
jgi:amidase